MFLFTATKIIAIYIVQTSYLQVLISKQTERGTKYQQTYTKQYIYRETKREINRQRDRLKREK